MTTFSAALAHVNRGDFAAAEQVLTRIIERERENPDALHLLANIRHGRGDIPGALDLFARAAALAPHDSVLAFNHGAVLALAKRHAEAEQSFARSLELRPGDAEALFARGASLAAIGRYAEALESYDAARKAGMTDRPALYANRGAALAALGRHEEAIDSCDRALAANPNDAGAHFNRGASLHALERSDEALAAFDRAITLAPEHIMARALRSSALANAGRFEEALADIDFAIQRQPNRADHLRRRAYVLGAADRRAEAIPLYDAVLAANLNDHEARYARADARLATGDFARGLEDYEARLVTQQSRLAPPSDAPLWIGEPLAGKTILVQGEQGFGDLFMAARFIPELAKRGARVIVQERPQTLALLQSLEGISEVISIADPVPSADYRIHTCSLMRALSVRADTIPAPIPYFRADPARVAHWREKLGPTRRKRVGICWAGNAHYALQRTRRLDTASLDRLLSANADFISLQFDPGAEASLLTKHNVRDFNTDTRDFAELGALIEYLDLVITVDTGVAHLAGALGKPLWIMLPFSPDWRWSGAEMTTAWYPQARLFRQMKPSEWSDVLDRILAELAAL